MKILLIEDEIKLANAVKRALELQKYVVDIANDGETGLDLAIGEKYNIILLDLMLPKIDGVEICKEIRRNGINTPVLMLTAKGQISDKVTGLDVGADDYMVKPFSFEELFARIRALTRRPSKMKSEIVSIKDLIFDPVALKVKRGSRFIELSAKEFSILEYLLKHKNTVVTKNQIVQSVWNYDTNVLPSTVEVHIKHLRDKIDKPFKEKLIKTVRGFGYEIGVSHPK